MTHTITVAQAPAPRAEQSASASDTDPPAVGNDVGKPGRRVTLRDQGGMATAEYAIATLAAAGFAGVLALILASDQVRGFLTDIIERALN